MHQHKCAYCGHTDRPVLKNLWMIPVTVLIWLVPITFLSHGYWPFFLVPAIAVTVWSLIAVKRECTRCGRRLL